MKGVYCIMLIGFPNLNQESLKHPLESGKIEVRAWERWSQIKLVIIIK
jgi:hypothetical protein